VSGAGAVLTEDGLGCDPDVGTPVVGAGAGAVGAGAVVAEPPAGVGLVLVDGAGDGVPAGEVAGGVAGPAGAPGRAFGSLLMTSMICCLNAFRRPWISESGTC
jgi:hypothetical protein